MTNHEIRKRLALWGLGEDEELDAIIEKQLDEREHRILYLRYACGLSWRDVGKQVYLAYERVKHIECETILPRIKEAMHARSKH